MNIDPEKYLSQNAIQIHREEYAKTCKDELLEGHLNNFLWNLKKNNYDYPGILGFEKIFNKYPAIVVGAGPSLEKNGHLLKPNRNKFVLIALDAALPILVNKYGIYPDIVVMVDPTEKQKYNFENIDTTKFYTIVPTVAHPSIFRVIDPNHICVYNIKDPKSMLLEMIPYFTGRKGAMPAGVLSSGGAFTFAGLIGCDPITFIGHDLCWENLDKVYSDGVVKMKHDFQKAAKFKNNCLLFPDINGKLVVTHRTFVVFYMWLRDSTSLTKVKVFNSSESGILKMKTIKPLNLEKYINKYCQKELIDIQEKIVKAHNYEYSDGNIEKILLPPLKRRY